ncbi:hypothetical protein BJY04DRAFT_94026 [Aspergillus karnatakaensis]|uniref:fungal specific transcription factor domain-containing protein n=1 Tax=Aspergillus karnatakaensis TaxID=1810916 RepID=UPI003CCCD545
MYLPLQKLLADLEHAVPFIPVDSMVQLCISAFFQRTFHTAPICHEPTLRADAEFFFGKDSPSSLSPSPDDPPTQAIKIMRSFTLLTTVCATMAALYGSHGNTVPHGSATASVFLRASVDMLKQYEDYDLRHPNSTSLSVRILLAACFQQCAGENPYAFHLVGQASLLARTMQLHTERAVSQYDNDLEVTLLRNNFWALYTADSCGACTRNRPVVLYEPLFDADIDLEEFGNPQIPLLCLVSSEDPGSERSILEGFHLIRRLWSLAAELLSTIRAYRRNTLRRPGLAGLTVQAEGAKVAHLYSEITTLVELNKLPLSLQPVAEDEHDPPVTSPKFGYSLQRHRLFSSFHCAKLMIIHESTQSGLSTFLGLQQGNEDAEKINTARAFVHVLQNSPFHYLQGGGEVAVELIRVVGSILLEILSTSSVIYREPAQSVLDSILDLLARLNSKASESILRGLSRNETSYTGRF